MTKKPRNRTKHRTAAHTERTNARTTVYRLAFGDAKTGLRVADPLRDSRKKPRYDERSFRDATDLFMANLPKCRFDAEREAAVLSHFNALRPNGVQPVVIFDPATMKPTDILLDPVVATRVLDLGSDMVLREVDLTHLAPPLQYIDLDPDVVAAMIAPTVNEAVETFKDEARERMLAPIVDISALDTNAGDTDKVKENDHAPKKRKTKKVVVGAEVSASMLLNVEPKKRTRKIAVKEHS
jgi:hypothetical protein